MKYTYNNIARKAVAGLLLLGGILFTACGDDNDVVRDEVAAPQVVNSDVTPTSLLFSWKAIEGATQYAYQLRNAVDEVITGGVTVKTQERLTGLEPDTEYTLNVWTYGNVMTTTASQVITLKARTNSAIKLATPTGIASEADGANITVTWGAVQNATSYDYTYTNGTKSGSGSVNKPTVTLNNLPLGDYTFTVKAQSSTVYESTGEAVYAASDEATTTFTRNKIELWRVEGIYSSQLYSAKWPVTLAAYDDGSYALLEWFGVEGYDLGFVVENGMPIFTGTQNGNYYHVQTGTTPAEIKYYVDEDYASFEGNKTRGEMVMYCTAEDSYAGYDYFTWGTKQVVWSAEGTYTSGELAQSWPATIEAYKDGTYAILAFYGEQDYNLCFTLDEEGAFDDFAYYDYNDGSYTYIQTGLEDNPIIYFYAPYAQFEGDADGGSFTCYAGWSAYGYDAFEWGASSGPQGPTIDDLVGTYTMHTTGIDWYSDYDNGAEMDYTSEVTITKVDDETIQMPDPYWTYNDYGTVMLTGHVDFEAKTITFDCTEYYGYIFADENGDETTKVVATFDDDMNITISGWAYFVEYGDAYYPYWEGTLTTLTKK